MKKALAALAMMASAGFAQSRMVLLPNRSPLVTLRVVFLTGSAYDPPGKPGVAYLTAHMLADGGTRQMTYKQVLDAMYPMAISVPAQVDKEMTTFTGATHVDNLDAFYKIFHAMLLDPGWREDDFKRVKDDAINYLRVGLRGNNDEELGKEVLYDAIYEGTPYGHNNAGAVSAIEKLTLADLKEFYRHNYTQANLIVGMAGGYPKEFFAQVAKDFRQLPKKGNFALRFPALKEIEHNRALIVRKDTRSVAYSIGYPIHVKRGDSMFPALLLAQCYLGQHRLSSGRLYDRMREQRGLNYGDYAYIEYFPRGMFQFEPDPNLARHQQIFQIWIRPVEPATAHFALRLAMYELNRFVKEGISQESFERTRDFLMKYVNLLTKTQSAELGYAIDSQFYDIPEYNRYLKDALAKLTCEDVNRAIRANLRADSVQIVAVAKDAEGLKKELASSDASPMTYNSPKPPEILDEDKTVEKWDLGLRPEDITIVPADKVFE